VSRFSVIGSGFSGLSAACFLAKSGHGVYVLEKNKTIGGRARAFSEQGFMFDMGPSWYWMPDTFERFFGQFNRRPGDYYDLVRLDPGFQIIHGRNDVMKIPAKLEDIYQVFEEIEAGSADRLKKFLLGGEIKYRVGMQHLVYKPSYSWLEYASLEVVTGASRLHMFKSVRDHVRQYFKDERLIGLMEFPVLFLGAMAKQIPALYSLMNYAALSLGTWYPMGGMTEIVKGMESLARSSGVEFITDSEVEKIHVNGNLAHKIQTSICSFPTDGVIGSADYHHIEQSLLDEEYRNYKESFWDKKTFAPSSLIFYIGVNRKLKNLIHHNLFFDTSMDAHSREIYEEPRWPENPLFYACCPSKTDPSVAPQGMENLFLLIPVAPGLKDSEEMREHYFQMVIKRMEQLCDETIMPHIVYKKSYCINDFVNDYNAYKGNAYGLANTLRQTAVLKPSMRNKKVKNMFYAGQLTVPGPGVPPALISGQVAAGELMKYFK